MSSIGFHGLIIVVGEIEIQACDVMDSAAEDTPSTVPMVGPHSLAIPTNNGLRPWSSSS